MTSEDSISDNVPPSEENNNDSGDDDESPLCTHAITGADYPAHQAIFICDTCQLDAKGGGDDAGGTSGSSEDEEEEDEAPPLPSCICQSCAETCHADHQVYYVGMGPCTCDCPSMVIAKDNRSEYEHEHECRLAAHSAREAQRLGFGKYRSLNEPIPLKVPPPIASNTDADAINDGADDRSIDGEDDGDENEKNIDEDDGLSQQMSNLCIECQSTMGGYTYASFTLPILVANDDGGYDLCKKFIRQAEVLTEYSHDTFWLPGESRGEDNDAINNHELCDLELLARQIYRQHMQTYSLKTIGIDGDATKSSPSGGAEWWVQVKPAGTARAPVDLHYDKDEILAEKFGLGSFPTISTVTYLTAEEDNAPTIVFPHTYNDEEERPIETFLLSHPARAKHLVFDGRLLHGAPAHPALRRKNDKNEKGKGSDAESGDRDEESSLRVTFLVNIWVSGRPAGVHVLPESIRAKIRSCVAVETACFQSAKPLEFQQRHVSKLTVPAKSSVNSGKMDSSETEKIVLPFVSHGATWIGDGDDDEEVQSAGEGNSEVGSNGDDTDGEDGDEEEDDDDEDDELVLVLSPFCTPEYIGDKADTVVLSFQDRIGAKLVRKGALDATDSQDCRWRKLIESSNIADPTDDDHPNKTIATEFLAYLHQHVPPFVTSIISELNSSLDMDVTDLQADHVCYRTDSMEQYTSLVEALQAATDDLTLLIESEIGGRPISTFKLTKSIQIVSEGGTLTIDVIEIPSPKEGSPYKGGLEHIEFVIGDGSHESPLNGEVHQKALKAWMGRYPTVPWDIKAFGKACNPDVSTKLEVARFGSVSIKFHLIPLEDVIKFEVGKT